jgi:2-iminobutanoate/2-iminopropanoate deaminase
MAHMKNVIFTPDAPSPENVPYSQGVEANGFIFSGQGPHVPGKGRETVDGGIEAQTRRCIDNLQAVLEERDATLEDVVKVTVYLTDIDNYEAMNEVYSEYFPEDFPARATLEVSDIPFGGIAVDTIAVTE